MTEKENPAQTGSLIKIIDQTIPQNPLAVKSPESDNLIFFNSTLEHLPAEEYKTVMVAVCHYLANGVIPPLEGLLKSVFMLATARIREQQSAPRKRGGQRGNSNARRTKTETNSAIENESETNKNESKTNQNESVQIGKSAETVAIPAQIPAPENAVKPPQAQSAGKNTAIPEASPQTQSSAQSEAKIPVAVPAENAAEITPPNLNLKLNLNNNIKFNYLNCENETKTERINRIKTNLKRFGFVLADKTVTKIIESVPDIMWLTQGCDFPTYLAEYVTNAYKNKGKTRIELQKLFLSALNREKWETPWVSYPNWLTEKMEQVLIDQKAILRKTPPQNYCPDCGQETKLVGLRCPVCGGFYEWDESTQSHGFIHHLDFDFNGALDRLVAIKRRKEQEASNANTVQ
jgi:hypothetical protein